MISRRIFVKATGGAAVATALPLSRGARFSTHPSHAVGLDGVWLGIGPLVAAELRPGLLLPTAKRRGRIGVFFDGDVIGWLPSQIESAPGSVRIVGAQFDRAGRLKISVAT